MTGSVIEPMNKLVIITAPSGAGKTSIVKKLLQSGLPLGFSVSACTRNKRPGEVDGKDYYFISADEFRNRVSKNEFAEYEQVYEGLYYGTLKSEIERIWKEGKAVLFDIDVQGAMNLKKIYGDAAMTLFIKAPSEDELVKRLSGRNTETPESLAKRISKSSFEMSFEPLMDKVVINNELERAAEETIAIVKDFLGKP